MTLEGLSEFFKEATGWEWTGKIYTGVKTIEPKTTEELMEFITPFGGMIHSYIFHTPLGHEYPRSFIVTPTCLEEYSEDISSDREGSRGDWFCSKDYSREWVAFQNKLNAGC